MTAICARVRLWPTPNSVVPAMPFMIFFCWQKSTPGSYHEPGSTSVNVSGAEGFGGAWGVADIGSAYAAARGGTGVNVIARGVVRIRVRRVTGIRRAGVALIVAAIGGIASTWSAVFVSRRRSIARPRTGNAARARGVAPLARLIAGAFACLSPEISKTSIRCRISDGRPPPTSPKAAAGTRPATSAAEARTASALRAPLSIRVRRMIPHFI